MNIEPTAPTECELSAEWDRIEISLFKNGGDTITFPFLITLPPKYQQGKKCMVQLAACQFLVDFGASPGAWYTSTATGNNWIEITLANQSISNDQNGKPSNLLVGVQQGTAVSNGTYNNFFVQYLPTGMGMTTLPSITTTNSELWLTLEWFNVLTNASHILTSSEFVTLQLRLRVKLIE